ncbi:hypothetical protein [Saccharopolyspora dendranthemae]|uniref:Uncharacterized protein n=1 Tax=Saccharopolyspora dendranthemae TaxID=1181886 RepID=A0A561U4Z0_9PSEU|nr:hypothetical protein [Saccharopolyspora dendranthemae]TWF94429.1 hypothetical protein FHU35_13136 [Saccharopolyspora dendranthemae]
MPSAEDEGPDEQVYKEVLDAEEESLQIELKDGTLAVFNREEAELKYTNLHGYSVTASAKVENGKPTLKKLQIEADSTPLDSISIDRTKKVVSYVREQLKDAYAQRWDRRSKTLAESALRKLRRGTKAVNEEDDYQVAVVYSLAHLLGKDPVQAVKTHFGFSEATAKRRIKRAREERGLLPAYSELAQGSIPNEESIPWLEPDDPQFLSNINRISDEMSLILHPRLYTIIRGMMFFEMLGQIKDGEKEGVFASERAQSTAAELLDAMIPTDRTSDDEESSGK